MQTKIVAIGAIYLDINALHFPLEDGFRLNTEIVGKDYEAVPGGSTVNFARLCASLHMEPTLVGKRGNDVVGMLLQELLKKEGITTHIIVDQDVSTNMSLNYTSDSGNTLMSVLGTANQSLSGKEVLDTMSEIQTGASYYYLGGCFKLQTLSRSYQEIVMLAKNNTHKIIIDHGRINNAVTHEQKNLMKNLIEHAYLYLPSKDEFLALWEVDTIEAGIEKIKGKTSALIVVKDGENGVYGWNGEKLIHMPSFPVTVTNLIGAGDSFNAGFIKAHTQNMDFAACLQFGNATAAYKISQNKLPTMNDIQSYLSTHI